MTKSFFKQFIPVFLTALIGIYFQVENKILAALIAGISGGLGGVIFDIIYSFGSSVDPSSFRIQIRLGKLSVNFPYWLSGIIFALSILEVFFYIKAEPISFLIIFSIFLLNIIWSNTISNYIYDLNDQTSEKKKEIFVETLSHISSWFQVWVDDLYDILSLIWNGLLITSCSLFCVIGVGISFSTGFIFTGTYIILFVIIGLFSNLIEQYYEHQKIKSDLKF